MYASGVSNNLQVGKTLKVSFYTYKSCFSKKNQLKILSKMRDKIAQLK